MIMKDKVLMIIKVLNPKILMPLVCSSLGVSIKSCDAGRYSLAKGFMGCYSMPTVCQNSVTNGLS